MRFLKVTLLVALFLLYGCSTLKVLSSKWHNLPDEEKINLCQHVFETVKPKCQKLVDKGQKYADFCAVVVDDAITGCEAIIKKDGSVMCDRIEVRADQCNQIPDDSANKEKNVKLCQQIVHEASLICKLLARPVPVEENTGFIE